ncbi:MAG: PQQ-binding-like beta-propeller repeat protein [Myxococcales bacterium]|nr:PQQ-binding-like beta-propeller repeat protein [Myxococcales bacterium]MCB9731147.1 PQQ-binding-like beta-propeller repeat protein [Deltaproteobacteria bacterium]
MQKARIVWQLAVDSEIRSPPLALADGVLLVLERDGHGVLRRLPLEEGRPAWSAPLDARPAGGPVRTGDVVAVPLADGRIAAFRLATGEPMLPAWPALETPAVPPLAGLGGVIYARSYRGGHPRLTALAVGQAEPLWEVPDPIPTSPDARFRQTAGVIVAGGTLGGEQVVVTGLDPATGKALWSHAEADCVLHDLWAVGGIVDVVTSASVVGLLADGGELRNIRFTGFPFDSAYAVGEHLVTLMDGHMGPVLLSFDVVSQKLIGRVSRAMTQLVAAHAEEVLVTRVGGEAAFYTVPALESIAFPEAYATPAPRFASFARDVCYVVPDHGRSITAIDLNAS